MSTENGFFESFKDMDRLIDFLIIARQPKNQIIYLGNSEYERTNKFFDTLGSSGVVSVPLPNTAIGCMKVVYRGFDFNIVNIDKIELIAEEMTINKGDLLHLYNDKDFKGSHKTFLIKEVGINEFIAHQIDSTDKIRLQFFKKSTEK